jgi:cobalt/nickel transport system permease protein
MHMSDALISPLVGGTMFATSGGVMGYSIRSLKMEVFEKRLPLMGVMGAFLFASQMINFSIPGTGSSGHIGGGLLLSVILGPAAGFLTMACVLIIQALFFADGGFLALGCNLINLGFFASFIAYPYVFRKITAKGLSKKTIMIASILGAILALQLGSFAVVVETFLSGRVELPLTVFLMFMQPIHLAIGIVEGVITGVVLVYLYKQNPGLIYDSQETESGQRNFKKVIPLILTAALLIGGIFSIYASSHPDGLEWAVEKTNTGQTIEVEAIIPKVEAVQSDLAILPDYELDYDGPLKEYETSVAGIFGSLATLLMALLLGIIIKKARRKLRANE